VNENTVRARHEPGEGASIRERTGRPFERMV
jgi:hypothetical protein